MSDYWMGLWMAIIKPPFAIAALFVSGTGLSMRLGILTIWPGAIFAWIAYAGIMGATA